jgi:hypothetical protein
LYFIRKVNTRAKEERKRKARDKEINTTQSKKIGKLRRKHMNRRLRERAR